MHFHINIIRCFLYDICSAGTLPHIVCFISAGLIVKSSEVDPNTGERHHLVQGITTAAATWLSAAVGIACGGGMYFVAGFSTALNLFLLRFGPRATNVGDSRDGSVASRLSWPNLTGTDIETGTNVTGSERQPLYSSVAEEIEPIKDIHDRKTVRSKGGNLRVRPSLM